MSKSTIEWTQTTWNPTTGCDKISQGCKFCYAEIMSKRLMAMGQSKYQNNFIPTMHETELNRPYTWKKPRIVFVNSMSDLFHESFPLEFIQKVFKTMNENPRHTFQVLTKRADRLADLSPYLTWSDNIWMGVSVEEEKVLERVDYLKKTAAKIKFLSLEPLIGSLPNLNLEGIHLVIVGGESGRKPRPMLEEWVMEIKLKCDELSIPFFFKQWGGKNKKKSGRLLQGKIYDAMPNTLIGK
jgi:protein gp37